VGIDPHRS